MGKPVKRNKESVETEKTKKTRDRKSKVPSQLNLNLWILLASFVAGVAITLALVKSSSSFHIDYTSFEGPFKPSSPSFADDYELASDDRPARSNPSTLSPDEQLNPFDAFLEAFAAQEEGDEDRAETLYIAIIDMARGWTTQAAQDLFVDSSANLGAMYIKRNNIQRAYEVLEGALRAGAKTSTLYSNLAYVYNARGEKKAAHAMLARADRLAADKETPEDIAFHKQHLPGHTKNDDKESALVLGPSGNFSVVVAVHVGSEAEGTLLLECLNAVLESAVEWAWTRFQQAGEGEQSSGGGGELIVVNDASPDGLFEKTWEEFMGSELVRQTAPESITVRSPLHLTVNVGAGAARNAGASVATGSLLAWCDADDVWLPKHLSTVLPPLLRNPELTHARTRVTMLDVPGEPVHPDWLRSLSATLPSTLVIRRHVHDFFQGFPTHSRYSDGRDMEDVHYALMLQETPGEYLNTFTVYYRWKAGGRLDQQLPKFRQPMENNRQLAAELERYHQTPQQRWYVHNAMRFTAVMKVYMQHKMNAFVESREPPPPLEDDQLPPLMGRAPWLLESETENEFGVVPYSGAGQGSMQAVQDQVERARSLGLSRPRVILVAHQPVQVLDMGALAWMKFPASALNQCRTPCVWLQRSEDDSAVDIALHYCGAHSADTPEGHPTKQAYLCAEQLQDRFRDVNLNEFDITMTQHSSSHIQLKYVPPPTVWREALQRWPTAISPGGADVAIEGAKVALFVSNNASRWQHCSAEGKCWGRWSYLQELMSHIEVDSFGSLLHNRDIKDVLGEDLSQADSLELGDQVDRNQSLLESDKIQAIRKAGYPFTLAFENNVEEDYVSEKMYEPLLVGSVPIYFGAPNAAQYAPKGSFIDASQFDGPSSLAKHLRSLLEDPEALAAMHEWRHDPQQIDNFLDFAKDSMYLKSLETVVTSPIHGYAEFSPAWLNNPKRTTAGRVEPYFNPCLLCDYEL